MRVRECIRAGVLVREKEGGQMSMRYYFIFIFREGCFGHGWRNLVEVHCRRHIICVI